MPDLNTATVNEQLVNFKKELHDLIKKYNAEITVEYSDFSDMHGVYQEGISVSIIGERGALKLTDHDWFIDKQNISNTK